MTDLASHVQDYLQFRRALGFKLTFAGHVLPQFVDYLTGIGATTITTEAAIAWAGLPQGVQTISLAHRLGEVRQFAKYVRTIDPATEVPPSGVWPSVNQRPTPYLWSAADINRLLQAARRIEPPLRAATHETLFGLLAASGMRIGEAIGLGIDDVDLTGGVITIRQAKFGRCRLVPLHPSVTTALDSYAVTRDRFCHGRQPVTFFVSSTTTALRYAHVRTTFNELTTSLGLRTATMRPRIHDLRHSFAVRTLIDWHRRGIDVETRMQVLSTYLGHVNPVGTYWYLSAAPELMELAAARLDQRYGGPR